MDFHILRWKFDSASKVAREFFLQRHRSGAENPDKPESTTVIVSNIPPYVDEVSLRNIFGRFGTVRNVFFQSSFSSETPEKSASEFFKLPSEKPITTYKVAYIVFHLAKSLEELFSFVHSEHEPFFLSTSVCPVQTGLSVWIKEQRVPLPNLTDIKKDIDEYMGKHDAKIEEEAEKAREMEGIPDEDGWVTVTRVGKKRGIRQTDVMNDEATPRAKKKAAEKELMNFYKFQVNAGKVKEISELRRKFEEDKQKVAQMKAARKFKPF